MHHPRSLIEWFADTSLSGVQKPGAILCSPTALEWKIERRSNSIVYTGDYIIYRPGGVALCRLPGRIVEWPGLPTDVYIYDPPPEIRRLSEGPCLQLVTPGGSWFKLHWEKPGRTFEESRAHVERMLSQLPTRVLVRLYNPV